MTATKARKTIYNEGDRLTDVFDSGSGPRRYLGTVTHSGPWTFEVTWDDHAGRARYTHHAEPATLRPVRIEDNPERHRETVAELGRLLAEHPEWPVMVRSAIDARRRALAGVARCA